MLFFINQLVGWTVNSYECQLSLFSHRDSPKCPHTFLNFHLANIYLVSKSQLDTLSRRHFSDCIYQIEFSMWYSHSIHFLTLITFLITWVFSLSLHEFYEGESYVLFIIVSWLYCSRQLKETYFCIVLYLKSI